MNGDKSLKNIGMKMVMPSGFRDKESALWSCKCTVFISPKERGFFNATFTYLLNLRVPGGMENKFSIPEGFSSRGLPLVCVLPTQR